MFKKALRFFLSFKHGLLVLIIGLVLLAFLLGDWYGSRQESSVIHRTPPLSEEEKFWQEEGLILDNGIYFVGSEIQPGIYRTKGVDTSLYGCNWQRLSGFGAENNNIIVNYYEDRGLPTIVEIAQSDKGFKTQGCGKWYQESIPVADNLESFTDGAFIVGVDIQPGVYKSSVQTGCYWERLSGLTREFYSGRLLGMDEELISRSNNTVVEIYNTDKGFISYNCKQWTRM